MRFGSDYDEVVLAYRAEQLLGWSALSMQTTSWIGCEPCEGTDIDIYWFVRRVASLRGYCE